MKSNTEFNRLKLKTDQLYLPLSGGKVNGETTFSKGVTVGSGKKEITINDGVIEGNDGSYLPITLEELEEGTSDVPKTVKADLLKNALLNCANPVGTIIHSTTCDTMAKVIEAYGGTTWVQHSGYMLRGATSDVTANHTGNDGGADSVSVSSVASHNHTQDSHNHTQDSHNHTQNAHSHTGKRNNTSGAFVGSYFSGGSANITTGGGGYNLSVNTENATATNQAKTATNQAKTATNQAYGATYSLATLPKYKNVYIWERTA